ncbi:hypothetical protein GRI62_06225 [Erythrobacter arachoides]|uniref:Uncharacterized protein n=1 Tax=Aurantiacibacter arachoides TaxID=1850444 RepID=A0A844ZYH5_9SPHN|nr:hypothetical protein [Aurantiacibacter arachoides]MXO93203.1 hypothetical protein [Aurantiacibacter arachoides]GGD51211.1 hypothetical protein GCM10011411_08800 [Aurantiacibacter arachoides]
MEFEITDRPRDMQRPLSGETRQLDEIGRYAFGGYRHLPARSDSEIQRDFGQQLG